MNKAETMIRRLALEAQTLFAEILAGHNAERGQTLIEGALVIGFVAILAVSLLTTLGDATGGALAEVSQAFSGAGQEQTALSNDAYIGPRIAD
jgi:Flp pilus assembly pilin Flp